MDRIEVNVGDEELVFTWDFITDSHGEIHLNKFLNIDVTNKDGDLLSLPTALMQAGWILSIAKNDERVHQFTIDKYAAKRREEIRNELTYEGTRGGVNRPSTSEVQDVLYRDGKFRNLLGSQHEHQKRREILEHVYWSIKSKLDILNKL